MKVQFELVVGENKFTLTEDVDSHSDFFKKLHFYSTLPKVGPNGETDLILRHRIAQGKYDYYSIVCESAKQEFKFGQAQTNDGTLFPKGWEPLYNATAASSDSSEEQNNIEPGTNVGLGATTQAQTKPTPVTKAKTESKPLASGLGAQEAPKSAHIPASNGSLPTDVQNKAKSVLAKFGV